MKKKLPALLALLRIRMTRTTRTTTRQWTMRRVKVEVLNEVTNVCVCANRSKAYRVEWEKKPNDMPQDWRTQLCRPTVLIWSDGLGYERAAVALPSLLLDGDMYGDM